MAELLTWADGQIKINDQPLPGELVSQNVDCQVRYDEQKVDGASGKKRTPQGWEPADASLVLFLPTDPPEMEGGTDCYEKAEAINKLFKGHDNQANPQVYDVNNRHLLARGIRQVIFSGFSTEEDDQEDGMFGTLSFIEHNPPVIKTEKAVAKSAHKKAAEEEAAKKAPDVNPTNSAGGGMRTIDVGD